MAQSSYASDRGAASMEMLQQRLGNANGPAFWRSIEELAGNSDHREARQLEFPAMMPESDIPDPSGAADDDAASAPSRRQVLKVMGASLALLGLDGCFYKNPQGTIAPYVQQPEQIVPGQPLYFASTMPFNGYGKGVLVLSREGRPIKIEGNPDHPASLGTADVFMQAALLDFYDPDRSRNVMLAGQVVQWSGFYHELRERLDRPTGDFSKVRLLTGTVTSPTLSAQIQEFLRKYPGAQWHVHDPFRRAYDTARIGPFTEPVNQTYDLSKASVIVALDSDFMYRDPASLRYSKQFIDGRRVRRDNLKMNRLYAAEGAVTITGSMADHRLPVRPSRIEALAAALAQAIGVTLPAGVTAPPLNADETRWVSALAAELTHPPDGQPTLVITGETQPPRVHGLVHLIHQQLGNIGKTVMHIDPVEAQDSGSLVDLVNDIHSGHVDTMLIVGVNPAYTAPFDLAFADALQELSSQQRDGKYANLTAHLATHYDETSYRCQWHIPQAHWLEAWGDVRAFDGTASVIQPLIAPLHGGRSEWELMEAALSRPDRTGLEIIRGHWMAQATGDFESWWMACLQKGVIDGSASPVRQPPDLRGDLFSAPAPQASSGEIEVLFQPDPNIWMGEFANNGWMQELPKPFTKLTWDNAIVIGLGMARKLGGNGGILQDGDMLRVLYRGQQLQAPVVLLPGQADNLIVFPLGYGRSWGGTVLLEEGNPRGFNAYLLRSNAAPWFDGGAEVSVITGATFLALSRNHHAMAIAPGYPGIKPALKPEVIASPQTSDADLELSNRRIVRTASLPQLKADPDAIKKLDPEKEKKGILSLYPGWNYDQGLQWGMSIDMTACIGCNACVLACQAENNIPVVGKDQVGQQREMHWIRVDQYFSGSLEAPQIYNQPVPCMHCENAPCEYVCPVGATTHSDEGLNEMTYNRCVGTRYCSNNCPYKVRRFNFLLYSDYATPEIKLMHNPDVTVRSRGVMEKCTYCVQRIDRTRIAMEEQVLELEQRAKSAGTPAERDALLQQAKKRGLQIVRGLQTACQQTCPTQAIVFGDIRDAGSDVARLKREPTDFGLLTELTTKPRTTYLAQITNPNPALGANAGGQS